MGQVRRPDARRSRNRGAEEAREPAAHGEVKELATAAIGRLSREARRGYGAVLIRAAKNAVAHNITTLASALAYNAFLAIPSMLLVAVGVFSLVASPRAIRTIIERLETVAPEEATALVESSLTRLVDKQAGAGIALVLVGGIVAIWSLTGVAQTLMWGLNIAYERQETRGFVRARLVGLLIVGFALLAVVLLAGLLILGPKLSAWLGDAVGAEGAVRWAWRAGQWPLLLGGLLAIFAAILYFGPNVDHPRWRFLTLGAMGAVLTWLVASAGFAFFVGHLGSYNKTWGSLAAVVITLTWLWLGGLALLFGAELNAEAERAEGRAAR
jgi:membrane protein